MKRAWGPAAVVLIVFFVLAARHTSPVVPTAAPVPGPAAEAAASSAAAPSDPHAGLVPPAAVPTVATASSAVYAVAGHPASQTAAIDASSKTAAEEAWRAVERRRALVHATLENADPDDCFVCHDDDSMTMEKGGREVSLFVDPEAFAASPHAGLDCVDCHEGFDPDEEPHRENITPVDCASCHEKPAAALTRSVHAGTETNCKSCHPTVAHQPQSRTIHALEATCQACHEEAVVKYERSLHGQAQVQGRTLAPTCTTCHGNHEIHASDDVRAKTYPMNIPELCGSCHKEGTTVSQLRTMNPSERHVLEDYSESIHGEGLLKRGLIVTAVCTSCHTSHDILPHENPASSIHRENIPETCMQCHTQVEEVHVQVINGELWEKRPHEIPVCVDCHKTHVVQRVFYERGFPNDYCMGCHADPTLQRVVDGQVQSLFVDSTQAAHSAHADVSCVKCHTDVDIRRDPVCVDSGPVDCSMCHEAQVNDFEVSQHGREHIAGNADAPYCTDCHGTHGVQFRTDLTSPTFPRNIPDLCGQCHRDGEKAAVAIQSEEQNIVGHYTESIHGKGLLESGLLVTATCTSCHTTHRELPADDPAASVNPGNVAEMCATCHLGVYEAFKTSVHSASVTQTDEPLPTCTDCHRSHTIDRVDKDRFRQDILDQCGRCHEPVTESYFDTFHGKVSRLGEAGVAKCSDCHGSHNILPTDHPASTLHADNRVETCAACHPGANPRFAGFLAHAGHGDPELHPHLFYTFWAMTGLLVSVFAFFGLHTLLWFPRELRERRQRRRNAATVHPNPTDGPTDGNDENAG